jgi:hypothetical protein
MGGQPGIDIGCRWHSRYEVVATRAVRWSDSGFRQKRGQWARIDER